MVMSIQGFAISTLSSRKTVHFIITEPFCCKSSLLFSTSSSLQQTSARPMMMILEVKGSDFDGLGGGFSVNSGFWEGTRNGSCSSSSLVLDCERGELVESQGRVERKAAAERTVAALKNHSESERRRRARINLHLDTLRNIVPGANKMDKASLLGEVIGHLKELKRNAAEASKGFMVPTEVDEVQVEEQTELDGSFSCTIKAYLCSDYKPGLLPDLRRALDDLHLKATRAEIATFGDRMKLVFLIEDAEARKFLAGSLRQALRSVVDKASSSSSQDFSNKKRRVSVFDRQSSFSATDCW